MPPATLSAVDTTKPRRSIARASRWQSGASSSTISNVRSDSGSPCRPAVSTSVAEGRFGRSLVSMILPLTPSAAQFRWAKRVRGRRGRTKFLHHLQIGTIPENRNMRAAFRQIIEHQLGSAALEEALRDEDAEPHMVCRTGAGRDVRLADSSEQVQREPRSVIGDLDGDCRLVPERGDADLAAGELDRVLNEVVEPMHDLGAAPNERLLGAGRSRRRKDQLYSLVLVQRPSSLDQGRNRQTGVGRAAIVLWLPRELREDLAAALGLAQQQPDVLGMWAVLGQIMRQLLCDDGDRRERAAQLVRRRRGQRADRRYALLAGERQ